MTATKRMERWTVELLAIAYRQMSTDPNYVTRWITWAYLRALFAETGRPRIEGWGPKR